MSITWMYTNGWMDGWMVWKGVYVGSRGGGGYVMSVGGCYTDGVRYASRSNGTRNRFHHLSLDSKIYVFIAVEDLYTKRKEEEMR